MTGKANESGLPSTGRRDPLIGQQIGNVRLTGQLGQGGFGTVYQGSHVFLDLPFAVKVLRINQQANFNVVARFKREARALAQLKHSNIVQFYDFGELSEHGFYMVMEYLDGENLSQRLKHLGKRRCLYSLPAIKRLVAALCSVFQYIHHKRIVHRDLKPSNIFFHRTEQGDEHIYLLDFGIVAVDDDEEQLTNTGVSLGTATYMSPEQAQGFKDLDGRSDLYSLGVLLFRLLTGRPPFRGENAVGTIVKHIQEAPPSLSDLATWKPWAPELEAFLQSCLAKQPEGRPDDAIVFQERFFQAMACQEALELASIEQAKRAKEAPVEQQKMLGHYEESLKRSVAMGKSDILLERVPFVASHVSGEESATPSELGAVIPTGELASASQAVSFAEEEQAHWQTARFVMEVPEEPTAISEETAGSASIPAHVPVAVASSVGDMSGKTVPETLAYTTRPSRAAIVVSDPASADYASLAAGQADAKKGFSSSLLVGIGALAFLLLGSGGWMFLRQKQTPPVSAAMRAPARPLLRANVRPVRRTPHRVVPRVAPRQTIVVPRRVVETPRDVPKRRLVPVRRTKPARRVVSKRRARIRRLQERARKYRVFTGKRLARYRAWMSKHKLKAVDLGKLRLVCARAITLMGAKQYEKAASVWGTCARGAGGFSTLPGAIKKRRDTRLKPRVDFTDFVDDKP
jgi:serine/threonine protein kinase